MRDRDIERRRTFTSIFKAPKVDSILAWESKLTTIKRGDFQSNYGSILGLLHTRVDTTQLSVFTQFYDRELHCFTFQDFQVLPTLEEFERILDVDIEKQGCYMRKSFDDHDIAKALLLDKLPVKETKGGYVGFSKEVLEDKAQKVLLSGNWKANNAIFALLIYGLVLFPRIENFVDFSAVGVFLSRNPVPALLADFLYSVHDRHGAKRGGQITCCVPLIQKWLDWHMPKRGPFANNTHVKWYERFSALTEKDIEWYSRDVDFPRVLLKGGSFSNVPLIGTRGCINYNPRLALRQLGHALKVVPKSAEVEEYILEKEVDNPILWNRIKDAWGRVNRQVMGRPDCVATTMYTQWIEERVQLIKMPYTDVVPIARQEPEPDLTPTLDEFEAMKAVNKELQEKNSDLAARCSKYQEENEKQVIWFRKEHERLGERNRERERKAKELQEKEVQIEKDKVEAANRTIERLTTSGQKAVRSQNDLKRKYQSDLEKAVGKHAKALRAKEAEKKELERALQAEREKKEKYVEALEMQKQISAQLDDSLEILQRSIDEQDERYNLDVGKLRGQLETLLETSSRNVIMNCHRARAVGKHFGKLVELFNVFIGKLPDRLDDAEVGLCVGTADKRVVKFVRKFRKLLDSYKQEIRKAQRVVV